MCLGIPGQIVEISDRDRNLGLADVNGVRRKVNLTCIIDDAHAIDACVGDWVLIHVGFAMSRIDEKEAAATLKTLLDLGEMQEQMMAMANSGRA